MDQSNFSAGPSTQHQQAAQSSNGDDAELETQFHEIHNIQPMEDAQLVAHIKHSLRTIGPLLSRTSIDTEEPMLEQWREGQLSFNMCSKDRWNHQSDDKALFEPIAQVLRCLVVGDLGSLSDPWSWVPEHRRRRTRTVNGSHCPGANVRITMAHTGTLEPELDQLLQSV
jgi:hypothetical protein